MKVKDVGRAANLLKDRARIEILIKALNECNSPDENMRSIPDEVLSYVDTKLAAKGLLSLLIESSAQVEKELAEIGVHD